METDNGISQALLTALADHKVPCPSCGKGSSIARQSECPTCDTVDEVLDPLTEPLRVKGKCGWAHPQEIKAPENLREDWEKHYKDCPGYRPATPAEAKSLLEEMLEALMLSLGRGAEITVWPDGITIESPNHDGWYEAPFSNAILRALAAAIGVEVTEEKEVTS